MYEDAPRSVLKELYYDLVGRPVIKRLNELNAPEQSRVWWCPTSGFCSLPLHAMSPIPLGVGPPRHFLDLYIPSYTRSLSTLMESHKPDSRAIGKPSIRLVAQPDENMPEALKEMKEGRTSCQHAGDNPLLGEGDTCSSVGAAPGSSVRAHCVPWNTLAGGDDAEFAFRLLATRRS